MCCHLYENVGTIDLFDILESLQSNMSDRKPKRLLVNSQKSEHRVKMLTFPCHEVANCTCPFICPSVTLFHKGVNSGDIHVQRVV